MTAAQIDRYLKGKGSPLSGYGKSFVSAGRRYGVSPALLVAIAGAESSFGKIESGTNNSFGWGPGYDFASREAGINAVAKGLKQNYLNKGLRSIAAIGAKYAPGKAANDPTGLNSHWTKNVTQFYKELGAGGALTAPASPSEPQIDTNMGSAPAVPDLSSAALTSLGRTSQGRTSPNEDLSDLVAAVSAGGVGGGRPVSTGASPPSTAPSPGGGITYTGQKITHDTDGLPGFPAVDLFAKPGTPFTAPEDGRIVRHSGRGGTSGQVYGRSIYFQGKSGKLYFVTHLGTVAAKGSYRKGQQLGTVSAWSGGSPHAHVGIQG